jgi:hypothetical protein
MYAYQHFHLQTDALLAGQASLLVEPHPAMVDLPDPYEPSANAPYRARCIDCSLFRGKYYLYFGVAPVVTVFLPFRLLFGVHLPENVAAALLMFGGFAFSAAALLLVVARHYPETPFGLRLVLLVLIAFSNFAPFILRRPMAYEVAVAAGFCFAAGAVYFLLRGVVAQTPSLASLASASLFLGLAAGSRPHHGLAFPLLVLAFLHRARSHPSPGRLAAAVLLPFSACCLGLVLYNHARFGEWLEFGQTYVVDGLLNHPRTTMFSPSYLPSHLYLYFLSPPSIDLDFPFFHLYPSIFPDLPHSRRTIESVSGLIPSVPAVALSALSPLLLLHRFARGTAVLPRVAAVALLGQGLAVAGFASCFLVVSARYFVDFVPFLLLSASLVALQVHHLARARRFWRAALHCGVVLLTASGTLLNLGVGLTGYYDLFRKGQPETHAAIEDRFLWLQKILLRVGGRYGPLELKVRLGTVASKAETLLAVGDDRLCIRRTGDRRVVFRFDGREGTVRSPALALSSDPTTIEVHMGSLLPHMNLRVLARLFPTPDGASPRRRLSVRVDGDQVLSGTFDFQAVDPAQVELGRGGGDCPADFSGSILAVRRLAP